MKKKVAKKRVGRPPKNGVSPQRPPREKPEIRYVGRGAEREVETRAEDIAAQITGESMEDFPVVQPKRLPKGKRKCPTCGSIVDEPAPPAWTPPEPEQDPSRGEWTPQWAAWCKLVDPIKFAEKCEGGTINKELFAQHLADYEKQIRDHKRK